MQRTNNKTKRMDDFIFNIKLNPTDFEEGAKKVVAAQRKVYAALSKLEEPVKKLAKALKELDGIDLGVLMERVEKPAWYKFWLWFK